MSQHEEDIQVGKRSLWILLAGIFLTSFSLLSLEITLTRVLSVALSYHYVFVVISLAFMGLGAGSIYVHFFRPQKPIGHERFGYLSSLAGLFSLSIPISLILLIRIAHIHNIQENILIYSFILIIPFFFAGALLAEVFRMFPSLSAKIYGADLMGAAAGPLGVILLLKIFGGLNTGFVISLLTSMAALLFSSITWREKSLGGRISIVSFLIATGLLGANLSGSYLPDVPIGNNPEKQSYVPFHTSSVQADIIETEWSAFGRTDLVRLSNTPNILIVYIDGTAGTPMCRFNGNVSQPGPMIEGLKIATPGYFPFFFLKKEEKDNALIIGPGGGRDILLALMGGVGKITAVEVNRNLVDIARKYSWYNGGIYTEFQSVDVVVDEGRNFLKRQKKKYDIIMLQFPYTESSRSLEGYVLTENFLFTTDSINDYWDHLTDEGRLVVACNTQVEVQRLLVTSLVALSKRAINHEVALKNVYMLGSEQKKNLFVLKKNQFEPAEISPMYQTMRRLGYDPNSSYFPYIQEKLNPELVALSKGELSLKDLERIYKERSYNIGPVSDDSPFFYKFKEGTPRPVSLVFWSGIILMLLVVLVPPWCGKITSSKREEQAKNTKRFTPAAIRFVILFSMLGMGFMLVEISLVQRFVLFLGQPTLSLAALLFSLLVGAGIGSICSGHLGSEKTIRGISLGSLFIGAILVGYTFFLPLIFNLLLGLSLIVRLMATLLTLTLLGFLMGFPFPLGMRYLKEMKMESQIPWMWGINGISSVLGSVTTIVIAINFGFTEALLTGAGCYFIIFLMFL